MSDQTLYPYQQAAVKKLICLEGRGGLFMEMGTGKTRVALAVAYLLKVERILIVAPLSAKGVWMREIEKVWPKLDTLDCTRGTITERAAALGKMQGRVCAIVGYESYWREPLRRAILRWEPQLVIWDEAHRLAHSGAKQTRFAHVLAKTVPHRLGLTGTPMPNGPQDLYAIFKALNPTIFGTRWMDFEMWYLIRGGFQGYQVVGYRNQADIERRLECNSYRITKREALDLPAQVDVEVPVDLEDETRRVYDEMKKNAIANVIGDNGAGVTLARVVVTKILRLQQITSGYAKLDDGQTVNIGTEKLDALRDLLSDLVPQAKRVVIFCRFLHDVDAVSEMAAQFGAVHTIDGRVSHTDRDRRIEWFRVFEPSIFVGQIGVSSLAIDLSCAHAAVFYAPDYSLTNYLQSRDRLHRIGQEQRVTYYHLTATGTIDEKIYRVLARKENLMKTLLDKKRLQEFFS